MFEYDSSHVTSGRLSESAKLRHDIAREDYAERKAARVMKEDALRRRTDRTRLIAALGSATARHLKGFAHAVLHGVTARTGAPR